MADLAADPGDLRQLAGAGGGLSRAAWLAGDPAADRGDELVHEPSARAAARPPHPPCGAEPPVRAVAAGGVVPLRHLPRQPHRAPPRRHADHPRRGSGIQLCRRCHLAEPRAGAALPAHRDADGGGPLPARARRHDRGGLGGHLHRPAAARLACRADLGRTPGAAGAAAVVGAVAIGHLAAALSVRHCLPGAGAGHAAFVL